MWLIYGRLTFAVRMGLSRDEKTRFVFPPPHDDKNLNMDCCRKIQRLQKKLEQWLFPVSGQSLMRVVVTGGSGRLAQFVVRELFTHAPAG